MTNPLTYLRDRFNDWRYARALARVRRDAPHSIDEAVDRLASAIRSEPEALASFLQKDEDSRICGPGWGSGMGLRNGWDLWQTTSPLTRELEALGLAHGDDRSGYLYSAAWHRLKGLPFDGSKIVARFREHWDSMGCGMDGSQLPGREQPTTVTFKVRRRA